MASDFLFAAAVMGRVCVALIFLSAAPPKLRHRLVFEGVVANYRIAPRRGTRPLARVLPWVELAVAAGLVTPWTGAWAAGAAMMLLAGFAWAMAVNLRRGRRHIECGCGRSTLAQTLSWALVVRNLALAGLLAPSLAPAAAPVGSAAPIGVLSGLCAFLLYLLFNALASLPADARSAA